MALFLLLYAIGDSKLVFCLDIMFIIDLYSVL